MIYKRGKIYWCEFIFDGKRHRYSCKTADKKVAEEVENAIRGEVVRGNFNLPQKYKPKPVFEEIFVNYIQSLSNNVKRTIENKVSISNHFLPVLKKKNITDITQSEIKEYQLKRKLEVIAMPRNRNKRESEISFAYLNKEILILSNFFNFCIEKGLIEKNPCAGIKKLNTLSRLKTLSDEDIYKLIAGATNKLTKDLVSFLIYTGCRKGEALNLKWDDVDLQNGVIAIKGTKTKYDRYIPISKPLKELLSGIEKHRDVYMTLIKTGLKSAILSVLFIRLVKMPDLKICIFTI
ncbi:MAG: integrase [Candidatus Acididesulfobacter diazotrophicus]|jgi:integrase|uniref:Integrase n=1 Tax=Candidatus Acididesulfobacter diazotrophicus TaxID=2597226 RepID=A0A519BLQ7_9DELT|nr:MAG: integrase [Candidatus Acididesulfobacter diazotrophicus]